MNTHLGAASITDLSWERETAVMFLPIWSTCTAGILPLLDLSFGVVESRR
jgi:hypothetical protein